MSAPSPARDKACKVVLLYAGGMKHKTIANKLGISPRIARQILIDVGTWKPDPMRNGVERKGAGEQRREEAKQKALARKTERKIRKTVKDMEWRVTRCLTKSPTRGMTNTQAFAWRYKHDRQFKIVHVLRKRLNKVAKRGRGYSGNNLAWLGCTPIQLIAHIESQWTEGMSWDNYGVHGWHIDHKKPCAAFDLLTQTGRDACFHYTNLQPMWAKENIAKGDKWNGARASKTQKLPSGHFCVNRFRRPVDR